MDKPYENGVTALRISKHRVAIIRIILAYCPEYKEDLPWRNSSEAGDASKLLRGIIKTLEKEILEEFIATLPKHHQRKLGFLKTNPQNPLNTLYKNLNTLYQEIDKNLEREGLIWLISQQESPKCDLTRLQKISDLHRCFCKSLYCFQELTPTCLQCGVSLGSEKKLGKDVIRPNLSLEFSFPDHVPFHKCHYGPLITDVVTTAKLDNFQVVLGFPTTITQYNHFVDSDSNFSRMQAAMIICTSAVDELKHSMAVVRKNIDTVLLINDDVIRECHPTSWKELEQSIKDFLKNPLFRISVNFRCIACVMFESAY